MSDDNRCIHRSSTLVDDHKGLYAHTCHYHEGRDKPCIGKSRCEHYTTGKAEAVEDASEQAQGKLITWEQLHQMRAMDKQTASYHYKELPDAIPSTPLTWAAQTLLEACRVALHTVEQCHDYRKAETVLRDAINMAEGREAP